MDLDKNKDLFTSGTYHGFEVNSNYYKSKSNMKEILKTLIHCRDNIDRPLASRYVLDLNNDHSFDIRQLTRKVKEYFKSDYGFIYSFEYAKGKGLHLEIMMITDQNKYSPETVYNMLKKICFNLKGVKVTEQEYNGTVRDVVGLGYLPIKDKYLETGNKVGHSLKNPIHFLACVERASYLSKVASLDKYNYKEQVQYTKKFNTITG
ncbi:hypothetical protein [Acinetobacter colistiniresistens]|uniref:hypothetical protein n=1 Tax=Acinetobacter colistiniresistens TaxID=280145 RepID=UPI001250C469|nr:hypothetical protein [Acinetobacter colistiniresistens]